LLAALDGAGARHDDDVVSANGDVANFDDAGLPAEFAGDELVGLEDGGDGLDSGDGGDGLFADDVLRTDDADDGAKCAAGDFGAEAPFFDAVEEMLELLFGGVGSGDDDHGKRVARLAAAHAQATAFFPPGRRLTGCGESVSVRAVKLLLPLLALTLFVSACSSSNAPRRELWASSKTGYSSTVGYSDLNATRRNLYSPNQPSGPYTASLYKGSWQMKGQPVDVEMREREEQRRIDAMGARPAATVE